MNDLPGGSQTLNHLPVRLELKTRLRPICGEEDAAAVVQFVDFIDQLAMQHGESSEI